jgi:hypothetical protein
MFFSRLNGPSTRPVRSIWSCSLPKRFGSFVAASTTASAFSTVRRLLPVTAAARSPARMDSSPSPFTFLRPGAVWP